MTITEKHSSTTTDMTTPTGVGIPRSPIDGGSDFHRSPRRSRSDLVVILAAGFVVAASVLLVSALVDRGSTVPADDVPAVRVLDSVTGRVPSGSAFDAALVPWEVVLDPATGRVPSGSAFDAALVPWEVVLDPATQRVPSGSAFDAALEPPVVVLNPATQQVPSGSPFDAN